jgi:hypothetical protein
MQALIHIAFVIVAPTSPYHEDVKSVYLPAKYTFKMGMLVSVRLAFTNNKRRAVLKN